MADLLTQPPPPTAPNTGLATEQEAREVAEGAREKEWEAPSFVRQMFEGSFELGLVHPFPRMAAGGNRGGPPIHGAARGLSAREAWTATGSIARERSRRMSSKGSARSAPSASRSRRSTAGSA